jgi:predicted metal-dependent hydrolase
LIPGVVDSKREWIRRSEKRLREQSKFVNTRPKSPPDLISLRAIGQDWSVAYRQTEQATVTAAERPGQELLVFGDLEDEAAVFEALRRWLARKTREHVAPWLLSLASDRGLAVTQVAIRAQRTRWASCSTHGTISLNLRLMFLPQELVRYALLHELAHLREMNHSRRYWAFLASIEPNYHTLDRELRQAWRLVPDWILPAGGSKGV